MHLPLTLWYTFLMFGLMNPTLGVPVRNPAPPTLDYNLPTEVRESRFVETAMVLFQATDKVAAAAAAAGRESLNLNDNKSHAARLLVDFVFRATWRELHIQPKIRQSTNEFYGIRTPEITIKPDGSLAGWNPSKKLSFMLDTMKGNGALSPCSGCEVSVNPVLGHEGSYGIKIKGGVGLEKVVDMDSETLKKLKQLVPFEWPRK
ncbi:hypothetical protein F5890DRAFT_1568713 [Lentinula detonsa]|uniref:Uncharacterized protein n=1 Tax=Lentinula detonsa TaxID=2804962 RepID=A0AA38PRU7_9AGAR|nr:hypothetical protein F5890DRAFT_1568713 [Lentinula detonsa]